MLKVQDGFGLGIQIRLRVVETDIWRVAVLRLVGASIFRQLRDLLFPEGMETETVVVDPQRNRRRSQMLGGWRSHLGKPGPSFPVQDASGRQTPTS